MEYLNIFYKSLFLLFIIIDPIGYSLVFYTLTKNYKKNTRINLSRKASLIGYTNLMLYLFFGKLLLMTIDIRIESMKIIGGLSLFRTAYSIIYENSDVNEKEYNLVNDDENCEENNDEENCEENVDKNIAVYPLALGILSGPGTVSTIIIISYDLNDIYGYLIIVLNITIIYLLCYIGTLITKYIDKLNNDFIIVLNTTIGILLSSLSVTFIINGIKDLVIQWNINN